MKTEANDATVRESIDPHRVRVFSVITCITLALFLTYRFLTGHMPIFFVLLASSVLGGAGLVTSLLGKRLRLATHLTLLGASLSVGGSQIQDGRIESTSLWVISVIPFIAGHILGKKAIASYAVLGSVFVAFSMWGESLGFVPPTQVPPRAFSWINLRFFSLLAMTALGMQMARDNKSRALKAARKMLESEQAHRLALKHDEEKALFLAQMSQQIRSPMNGIKGVAQYWSTIAKAPEPRDSVDVIDRCADRLISMMQDVQDISKIEQGEIPILRERFLVNLAISDVARLFHAKASAKGLTLEVQGPDQEHWVNGDAQRLVQILANLVGNAIKFSDQGSIVIRWGQQTQDRYCFEVIDQGIGMTSKQLSKLFERYNQVNLDQGVLRGGSGLGLTISRALSQAMGGSLVANSEYQKGSTFTLSLDLPAACSAQQALASEVLQQNSLGPKNLRILAVEPDELSFIVLELCLESLGCKATRSTDEADALRLAQAQAFDLIILDLQTRRDATYQLIQQIREASELNRATPLLVTTLDASPELKSRCRQRGVAELLQKPLSPQVLLRAIERIQAPSICPEEAA